MERLHVTYLTGHLVTGMEEVVPLLGQDRVSSIIVVDQLMMMCVKKKNVME
jgi:hypothetical protein